MLNKRERVLFKMQNFFYYILNICDNQKKRRFQKRKLLSVNMYFHACGTLLSRLGFLSPNHMTLLDRTQRTVAPRTRCRTSNAISAAPTADSSEDQKDQEEDARSSDLGDSSQGGVHPVASSPKPDVEIKVVYK